MALIPASLRKACVKQSVPDIGAVATAVCLPPSGATGFYPDRWQVSTYPSGAAVRAAYDTERQPAEARAQQRHVQLTQLGRRRSLGPRAGQAWRAQALLLRRR